MIKCEWCGEEHYNPLMHVCFDGSTLSDRVRKLGEGLTPPSRALVTKYKKNDAILNLTPEDMDLLIGMKISW